MRNKRIIVSILIVVLLLLCGASLFAAWQGFRMADAGGFSFRVQNNTVKAEGVEEKTLTVDGPVNLTLNNDFGDVNVTSGADGQVYIKAEKTGWGPDEAGAQKALEKLEINIEQNGNSIQISSQLPEPDNVLTIGPIGASVKFTLTVPEESAVTLDSTNGNLALSGTKGDTDLQTDFGSITLSGVAGPVNARTTNGEVTIEDVTSDGIVTLGSEFGSISLVNSQASAVDVQSTNGKVTMENVTVDGNVTVRNDFGDQTLSAVEANAYDLKAQNGKIKLDQGRGSIKAHSDFGDVEVLGIENGTIDLSSTNGAITFSGSLATGPHSVASDFGNITLTLPPETALNIDLQTDFGKISSDFEITLSGALESNHWVGKFNGGGEELTVATRNGNITIHSQ